MSNENIKLYCAVNGKSIGASFPVEVSPDIKVDELRDVIKAANADEFSKYNPNHLTLWAATIPFSFEENIIVVNNKIAGILEEPVLLDPRVSLPEALPDILQDKKKITTLCIVVEVDQGTYTHFHIYNF